MNNIYFLYTLNHIWGTKKNAETQETKQIMDDHRKLKAVLTVYMRNEKYYYDRYMAVLTRHKTRTCQFCTDVISAVYIKYKCGKCTFNSCDACAKYVQECKSCLMNICKKCSPMFGKCSYCNVNICQSCMKKYDGTLMGCACRSCENKRCIICHISREKRIVCTIDGVLSESKNICDSCSDNDLFSFCSSCGKVVQTSRSTYHNLCAVCVSHAICEDCKAHADTTMCKFCIDKKLRIMQADNICILVYKNINSNDHRSDRSRSDLDDLNDSDGSDSFES